MGCIVWLGEGFFWGFFCLFLFVLLLLLLLLFALYSLLSRAQGTVKRDRLVGTVVKASASRAKDPGFESCLRRDFSGVESYQ